MLLRGSFKPEAFLTLVNRYETGGEGRGIPKVDAATGIAYLGAGYWRAVLWVNESSHLLDEPLSDLYGVTLVNPDLKFNEIQWVELGVAILASMHYRPTGRQV